MNKIVRKVKKRETKVFETTVDIEFPSINSKTFPKMEAVTNCSTDTIIMKSIPILP